MEEQKNNSPWLYQLRKHQARTPEREVSPRLGHNLETDVVIVGGGIAGVVTAYFLMTRTDVRVALIEAYKIGHGATGHNAGQVTSYFERSFASLVDEFGLELAGAGQSAVEAGWHLLDEIYTNTNAGMPFHRFTGHAGLSSQAQVEHYIHENDLRIQAGLQPERIRIASDAPWIDEIAKKYGQTVCEIISREELNRLLEVEGNNFSAMLSFQKGCVNSALFVEHVVMWLIKKYSDRISFFEHTPMKKVLLDDTSVRIDCDIAEITAGRVVLCTNGFNHFSIFNKGNLKLHTDFHSHVYGTIGYMGGYTEKLDAEPIAISYFLDPKSSNQDPYFYMTRRPFEEGADGSPLNLVCIGGPEEDISESTLYDRELPYPPHAEKAIDDFVAQILPKKEDRSHMFSWHGLMGYTKNKVRLVGSEPQNPRLIYNLGCNGVGILPSIAGGEMVAKIVKNPAEEINTIFSPKTL